MALSEHLDQPLALVHLPPGLLKVDVSNRHVAGTLRVPIGQGHAPRADPFTRPALGGPMRTDTRTLEERIADRDAKGVVATIEQATIQASWETRRPQGQQAQAFAAATLPLCRTV
jgi:hypothetical protein